MQMRVKVETVPAAGHGGVEIPEAKAEIFQGAVEAPEGSVHVRTPAGTAAGGT
jgi:hypothetical protein